jgi:hypothetical protein
VLPCPKLAGADDFVAMQLSAELSAPQMLMHHAAG